MMAFVWAYSVGEYVHWIVKPIIVKALGRRQYCFVRYGLDFLSEVLLKRFCRYRIPIVGVLKIESPEDEHIGPTIKNCHVLRVNIHSYQVRQSL